MAEIADVRERRYPDLLMIDSDKLGIGLSKDEGQPLHCNLRMPERKFQGSDRARSLIPLDLVPKVSPHDYLDRTLDFGPRRALAVTIFLISAA